jgi:uncharacterized membrane protein
MTTPVRNRPDKALLNLAWLALCAVGVVLRLWGLGAAPLSYDEAYTLLTAQASFNDMLASTAGDVHPPLWYCIEWVIVRLAGPEAWALRAPSVAFSLASLWLLSRLASTLRFSEVTRLLSVGLMAVLPFQLHYAQDARMYTLLQALVLWALIAALERRGWQLCASLTLALWTHNYGLFYLVVIAGLALVRELGQPMRVSPDRPWRDQANFVGLLCHGMLLPMVLYVPWAAVLAWQVNALTATGYWIPGVSLGTFLYPFYAFWWGITLPQGWPEIAAPVSFALTFFSLGKALKLRDRSSLLLAILIITPPLLALAASLVWQPIYLFRALIGVAPLLYLLVAWAITERVSVPVRGYALAVLAPFIVVGLLNRGNLQILKGPSHQVQEYIAAHAQPGDVIFHGNVSSMLGFAASGYPDLPQYLLPVQPGSVGTLTPQTRRALGLREAAPTAVSWQRAWLVWGAVPTIAGAEDAAIAAILAQYPHEQIINLDDIFTGDNATIDGGVWLLRRSP